MSRSVSGSLVSPAIHGAWGESHGSSVHPPSPSSLCLLICPPYLPFSLSRISWSISAPGPCWRLINSDWVSLRNAGGPRVFPPVCLFSVFLFVLELFHICDRNSAALCVGSLSFVPLSSFFAHRLQSWHRCTVVLLAGGMFRCTEPQQKVLAVV